MRSLLSNISRANEMQGMQEPFPYSLPKQILQRDRRMSHAMQETKVRANQQEPHEGADRPEILMRELRTRV